jgi:hypothetical protein
MGISGSKGNSTTPSADTQADDPQAQVAAREAEAETDRLLGKVVTPGSTDADPTAPAGRASTVFVSLSTVLITATAVLATVIMGLNQPVGGNQCLTTPTSTGIDNVRWSLMTAYTIAVVMMFTLRLKRIDQGHIAGYDIVGVFNGEFKNFAFLAEFGHRDQLLRMGECFFHVVAVVSSMWFLFNNGGLSECHDATFTFMMTVCFVTYYLCVLCEVIDGCLPGHHVPRESKAHPVDPKDTEQSQTVTVILATVIVGLAVVNLGFVFARLHHSHLSDVACDPSVNILLSIMFLLSMVTFVSYSGTFVSPNAHYRLSRWHPNMAPAFSALVCVLIVIYQYAIYENSAGPAIPSQPLDYTEKHFCLIRGATLVDTVGTTPTMQYLPYSEDKTGDALLEAQFWTLLFLSIGVYFIKRGLSATFEFNPAVKGEPPAGPRDPIGYVNTGLRPNTSASTLARNRLAGDGKKPYASVSTLQFV